MKEYAVWCAAIRTTDSKVMSLNLGSRKKPIDKFAKSASCRTVIPGYAAPIIFHLCSAFFRNGSVLA
jgi:hypothetical protein